MHVRVDNKRAGSLECNMLFPVADCNCIKVSLSLFVAFVVARRCSHTSWLVTALTEMSFAKVHTIYTMNETAAA
jgi:hypothetical protein